MSKARARSSALVREPDDQPDPDDVRAQILRAAAVAFMERGFNATSVDDIAYRLNATKGLVYHHFRTKSEIFLGVLTEAMHLADAIPRLATEPGTPAERMHKMAAAHALALMTDLPFHHAMLQGVEQHRHEAMFPRERARLDLIVRARDEYQMTFTKVIIEGQESGEFRQMDARLAVKALLGALNWTTVWFRPELEPTLTDRKEISEELATFVVAGLR